MRNITGTLLTATGVAAANIKISFALVDANQKPTSSFIAATSERVYGLFTTTTDANGAFTIELTENTLLVDETYYFVRTDMIGDAPFVAPLEEGAGDIDWLDFAAQGGTVAPATFQLLVDYVNDAELSMWAAKAERMTADSYATEPVDTFVKVYTSNGDGTFSSALTTEYSALHHDTKAGESATASGNSAIEAAAEVASIGTSVTDAEAAATRSETAEIGAGASAVSAAAAAALLANYTSMTSLERALPTKADFEAMAEERKANRSGSGFDEWGKHTDNGSSVRVINEGMHVWNGGPNLIMMGESFFILGVLNI